MEPKVQFKGGGSFVDKPPQFSADGQTVFVVWKNVIVCYNTKTAKRLRELVGLEEPVVGFQVHYVNNCEHVTACSSTGEVITWNVEMGLRVSKTKMGTNLEIKSFNLLTPVDDDNEDNVKFLLSWLTMDNGTKRVAFGYFTMSDKMQHGCELMLRNKKCSVAVNRSQNPYFAIVQDKQLYFAKSRRCKIHKHSIESKHFTCVACHPEQQECVITGDNLGRVILWYNLSDPKNATRAVYHWHTLPVRSLSFSSSGTNFYSGAGECVLVKWYLDNPNHKEFLPRIPSTIEHIQVSDGNQFIAVATADNAVRILDPRFETVSIIQHLVLGKHFPAGILYDQRTKSMVLNGLTGHVQFYSPNDMTLLYNLDIVGQNKLTQERNCHIENVNVTATAMDNRGLWLATVEERVDIIFSFELRLKFFAFNTVKQQFELNTVIELPHEKSVTSLLFQPSYNDDLKCVTVGNDKKFKVWQLVNADTVYHKGNAWTCSRVGFYRGLPCNALAFSCDGSLLSVGFGSIVTAWLPDTCELKCSLLHPTNRQRITAIQFGTSNHCHLLVTATSEQLSVWSLLSLSMLWTVRLPVSLLIASPLVSHMAVFTTDGRLFVFYPNSSQYLYTKLLESENENVCAAVFIPSNSSSSTNMNWYQGSQLFFINSRQELYCMDGDEDNYNDAVDILSDNLGSSLFTSALPQHKSVSTQQKVNPVQHLTKILNNNKQLKKLLDAPVHTMIPVRLTCESILRSVVLEHKLPTKQETGLN